MTKEEEHQLHLAADNPYAQNQDFALDNDATNTKVVRDTLSEAWKKATNSFLQETTSSGDDSRMMAVADAWWERLWAMHTEPSRHYHTVVHLYEMVGYFNLLLKENNSQTTRERHNDGNGSTTTGFLTLQQEQIVLLSIFFHDAVYNAQSSTNEEDSARLFEKFASEIGLRMGSKNDDNDNNDIAQMVVDLILATKSHQVEALSDNDVQNWMQQNNGNKQDENDEHKQQQRRLIGQKLVRALLLDLDLAVLGKTPDAYRHYAQLIRREYHFVPQDTYCSKRAEILQSLLSSTTSSSSAVTDHLYGTPWFRNSLQDRARANLQDEIDLLLQNIIPGEEK